ncbi:MAG TPA: membrane protein insertase YidC [Rhizomicrobium sp.]|jgi:YidC/Oxa1 family membrane protein insertase|nr:membrane protein insertase YidC [Rhizomicrobium sp.]
MNDNRNLVLAIALCLVVWIAWDHFVAQPQMQAEHARQAVLHKENAAVAPRQAPPKQLPVTGAGRLSLKQALAQSGARVPIDTPTLDGSLRLTGARFDDLRLKRYRETVNPKSPEITLLSPVRTPYPYYAMFGYVGAPGAHVAVPGDDTPWKLASGRTLGPGHPVTLQWNNGKGLVFTRRISVDDQYMFTISDQVANQSGKPVQLYPYGYVARDGVPETKHYWVLHEGFVGAANGALKDASYDDFKKEGTPPVAFQSTGGWVGITDKYWMAAAIPPQNQQFDGSYRAAPLDGTKTYQADYRLDGRTIAPGATIGLTQRLFAGAKVVSVIRHYEDTLGIERFDLAVDWGWFIFLTKPIFWLLDFFYSFIGNFGVAILLLTVTIKLVFFPLADASYRSMSRMKKLQPEVERIRERFAEDKMRQQQEMMALYKREKVNPVSGCLPMLIQIPVFFSLYKVLYVTIEMRHAPFFGWIHDLSAPDPTNFLNLFGLLPYAIPAWIPGFLHIGIWPVIMGVTQWLQTKMNPQPADPVQARMFTFMPLIFTFMLATYPAGLVIYWTWNNLLSTTQQYVMMKRQGVDVRLFNNLKAPAFLKRLGSSTPRTSTPPGE